MISIVTDMINEMLEESLEENFWAWSVQVKLLHYKSWRTPPH
jgi:hypothetical protein